MPQKIWTRSVQPLDVYWIQTNRQPDKQTDKPNLYIDRDTEKQKMAKAEKSKRKALQHFKVDPVLKINEILYKQAKSM